MFTVSEERWPASALHEAHMHLHITFQSKSTEKRGCHHQSCKSNLPEFFELTHNQILSIIPQPPAKFSQEIAQNSGEAIV
jgi:hypothetical protein